MKRLALAIGLLSLGMLCQAGPAAAAGPATGARVIVVKNIAFGPAPPNLRVGQTVEWINEDPVRHSATAKDGSFNIELPPGGRGRLRLKHAGTIHYYCRYHPGMTGTLTVGR